MPRVARRRKTARVVRRRRARGRGIASAIATPISRPGHYYVPTLIRWPAGLLAAVDAEVTRRKKKPVDRQWWEPSEPGRASTIRALVAERLHVSSRDGGPVKKK